MGSRMVPYSHGSKNTNTVTNHLSVRSKTSTNSLAGKGRSCKFKRKESRAKMTTEVSVLRKTSTKGVAGKMARSVKLKGKETSTNKSKIPKEMVKGRTGMSCRKLTVKQRWCSSSVKQASPRWTRHVIFGQIHKTPNRCISGSTRSVCRASKDTVTLPGNHMDKVQSSQS